MSDLHFPWLELSVLIPLIGAGWTAGIRQSDRARLHSLVTTCLATACTLLAWQDSFLFGSTSIQSQTWFRFQWFKFDSLNAPLLPIVGLIYLLFVLSTLRAKSKQISFVRLLLSESVLLALFSCNEPWGIILCLVLSMIPVYFDLKFSHKSTRVFAIHMGLQAGLLVAGWWLITTNDVTSGLRGFGMIALMIGILVRCGVAPFHCWMVDLFEHGSLGHSALFVIPMTGAYAGLRLLHPIGPEWCLHVTVLLATLTVLYSSGMSLIQRDARRFFAYLVVSFSSLVVVGLGSLTTESLAGGLCVWISSCLSLIGLGLTIRALESRIGRLSLTDHHGLYEHTPTLATLFLITGLCGVGFPGTVGFIAIELLVDGVVQVHPAIGGAVVLAMAFNGISVLRAYFLLFGGRRHVASISIRCRRPEMIAVITCFGLVFGFGLFPQSLFDARHKASKELIRERADFKNSFEFHSDDGENMPAD